MRRKIQVFGPAYLDRVLHVDRPLVDPELGPPLDQSVDGLWKFGPGLTLVDQSGCRITISPPEGWPGPWGTIELSRSLTVDAPVWLREVKGISWHDDLGGMGAGYAAALGGELVCALGDEGDATSRAVTERLESAGIHHQVIRVSGHPADWTLLVTSGEFGDKLPIGFRGCHSSVQSLRPWSRTPCELCVVAGLPNAIAEEALRDAASAVRFFAPTTRNMVETACPVSRFADAIDVLCCNRLEWESLADREQVAWQVSLLAITDGPRGSTIRFASPQGESCWLEIPAFPRDAPPRDTNRAGEAYASMLVRTLLDVNWSQGVFAEDLVKTAALRASAAAALELDKGEFGFATDKEVDEAIRLGHVRA